MKKTLFIAFFGILFLISCSNHRNSNISSSGNANEQLQESEEEIIEENEGAIDDSGETYQDSIDDIDSE